MTTRAITDSELESLDAVLLQRRQYRDRAFLWTAIGTGFRAGEVLGLQWELVLTQAGQIAREVTIERVHLKGGAGKRRKAVRSRRVPLTERVRGALLDYLGSLSAVPQGPLFRSRVGSGAISRVHAHRVLKRLARELGFDARRLGLHSTRKAFAERVYHASGHNLLLVQRALGHSSPLVTASYLDVTQGEFEAVLMGFDQPAAPASAPPLTAFGDPAATPRRFGS